VKFSLKELKRISKWFDATTLDLKDIDLKIYEKINDLVKDRETYLSKDPLVYKPPRGKKPSKDYESTSEYEEELREDDLVIDPYDSED